MQYSDFAIRLESTPGDGFLVKVETPAGDGETRMRLPADIYLQYQRLQGQGGIARAVSAQAELTRDAAFDIDAADSPSLEAFGTRLFQAMFGGTVGTRLHECVADLESGEGLRIKIYFDFLDEQERKLAELPWEYLYWPDKERFLGRSRVTPIVRYVEAPQPSGATPLLGQVRVLVVMSSPKGVHQLDLDKERRAISGIFATQPLIDYEILEDPTASRLQGRLALKRYHVLHFMGHGAYDESDSAGAIILEDEEGNPKPYSATQLAALLGDERRSLRLVVLNACETAKSGGDGDQVAPFGGVAARLVRSGLTAVLAMQALISDRAAIAFSRRFYECLVAGQPIDYATAEGRKAVFGDLNQSIEWGTPVLFMRTKDGQLWTSPARATEPAAAALAQPGQAVGQMGRPASAESAGANKSAWADKSALIIIAVLVIVFLGVAKVTFF